MSKNINVQMKQFNGTDYDNIFPDAKNGMAAQIIVTPTSTLRSIKATSSNGTVFNGVFKSPNWIIEVNEYGNYTIQGTKTTGETDSTELVVDECKQYEVSFVSNILNNNSWAVIRAVSDAGTGESYWAVGDAKQITINGTVGTKAFSNYSTYVYILGFNHNAELEGEGITFGTFKTALSGGTDICLIDGQYGSYSTNGTKYFNMNYSSNTNFGGWKGCDLRYDVLGSTNVNDSDATSNCATSPVSGTLMAALPSALRAVMKPMNIYTDNTGGGSNTASYVTKTVDYLPLLAEFEIFGTRSYANSAEQNYQAQYQYYKNGNSKVRYRHSSTGSTAGWWLRSVFADYSSTFCSVNTSGSASGYNADYSYGLAPAFRV